MDGAGSDPLGAGSGVPGQLQGLQQHSPPAAVTGITLDADVAANMELAWAKLYLRRLATSYEKHVEGAAVETAYPCVQHFPDILLWVG